MIKETITHGIQIFTWFHRKCLRSVSLKKQENYKGDTNTISQKPNPKYNKGVFVWR